MNKRRWIPLLALLFLLPLGAPFVLWGEDAEKPIPPEKTTVTIQNRAVLPSNGSVAGVWFFTEPDSASQLLLLGHPKCGVKEEPFYRLAVHLAARETMTVTIPAASVDLNAFFIETTQPSETSAKIAWQKSARTAEEGAAPTEFVDLVLTASDQDADFILDRPLYQAEGKTVYLSLDPKRAPFDFEKPTAVSPDFAPALADALIEWDWRMQDGIETPLKPKTFMEALAKRIPQGDALLADLEELIEDDAQLAALQEQWQGVKSDYERLVQKTAAHPDVCEAEKFALDKEAENLWKKAHAARRAAALANPLFDSKTPLLFAKHIPSAFSHQLTQYYGYCARPGGGIFVLEEPGKSMKTRQLTPSEPVGNYLHPRLTFDGKKIYFAFCEAPNSPKKWRAPEVMNRYYHLYSMNPDGSDRKELTQGNYDDFAPTPLPDGDVIFISSRRGSFHRCGGGPCYVYTLAKMGKDGEDPHVISFHETNEWDPTVTSDGRVLYTRWDYVDRDAVYYQNLWSTRQDGTDVRIFYGNNTFNPCGIWESQPIPNSQRIMAIGGPHHGMSAGSVITIDNSLGVDGSEPVNRLTPEVLYPEGETMLPYGPEYPAEFDTPIPNGWQASRPADRLESSEEEERWPVHTFKSPWPLSEKYFIASYSFDKLIGEAGPNIPNQFGIYLCDAFGTRELLYRDPNISSVWAKPFAPQPAPPAYRSALPPEKPATGRFYVQNIYDSWPTKIPAKISALRIVQVLPKTTPNANDPMVGCAFASPGKQVLGTVPVDKDGSAWFEAPAKIPILFQALDDKGRMVQGMRSLVYLQPGEVSSCSGCHEDRMASTPVTQVGAARREPSIIKPGPDGSKPFSYPILVQPILDKHCVKCHNAEKTEGNIDLTGVPDERNQFSKSYDALVNYVSFTAWGLPDGNHEPMTTPDTFGARASRLTEILEKGHYDCQLSEEEWERLNTWMDVNALFYGTFNYENQARQLKGERIEGPDLE